MKQGILLMILFTLFVSYTFAQNKIIKEELILRYQNCTGDLAIFVLENKTKKSIYARVQPVPFWKDWKELRAMYGTYKAEYKAPDSNSFIGISHRQDAYSDFRTIRPNTIIRYGIPTGKGSGVYKVSTFYIDNRKTLKMMDNFENLSSEEINQINWKEATSEETFIPCK